MPTLSDHIAAARALSELLDQFGVRHAFIGGFAWSLLGSSRATEDIDVLIEHSNIMNLKDRIEELDKRFATVALKLYFVTQLHSDGHAIPDSEALVRSSANNVMVETLCTGTLGLPKTITRTHNAGEMGIAILDPTILVLTKFKRWSINYTSDRPKTIRKTNIDRRDIYFMINWLAERELSIGFGDYDGKTKPELLVMIRKYYDNYVDDPEHMRKLQVIMSEDWGDMLALPPSQEEDKYIPSPVATEHQLTAVAVSHDDESVAPAEGDCPRPA